MIYTRLARPLLFTLPPDVAHSLAMLALAPVEYVAPVRAIARALSRVDNPRIASRVMGLDFRSPLGLAGGFDKNALRPRAMAALGFGHVEIGTVTARAQEANPAPNMFRLPDDRALVNRLGFPNEGAARVCARLRARRAGVPVAVSIGKSRVVAIEDAVDDYLASLREAERVADFVVVNVSSPNTKDLRAMQGAELARRLLGAIAKEKTVPVLVKVAPDLSESELEALLAVVEETKLEGVVATNTTVAREGLRSDARAIERAGAGGLSGPPLRARAIDFVRRARARLGAEAVVVGVGGVERAEHVMDLVKAGANLVQMYTGFIYEGPRAPVTIARELARLVEREGARSITELVGQDRRSR